ncbi:sensor histidine kinase [Romboutsia maritimum]|uniref:histidine kinase n=1 Tax=Romboutsia maritimum TaxID=2020948 RepID=A0A371IRY2_9FIRM|nr:HAMP domain-containing sensor histidine kinase [Romboutsia maritimum]RDY23225.1 sensor histidine kinase [Romboutsia maritimum]
MNGILDIIRDKERRNILISLIIVFIIGYFGLNLAVNSILCKIESDYINQNISIVGQVVKYNPELEEEIVATVTGKDLSEYELGKRIMEKYSYNTNISRDINPLTKNIISIKTKTLFIFWILFFICTILSINHFIKKIVKNIKSVTKRAENIIEGRISKVSYSSFEEGIFSKFNSKFDLMEERMNKMIDELKEEKITLKNIINDISHQLKTPLSALTMYNDIMLEYNTDDDEDMKEFINLSKDQLGRMNWLITTLLKYARLECNSVKFDKEMNSINETIYDSISRLRKKAELKQQKIEFIAEKDVKLMHDRNWMSEAIANIIKNSIEHTDVGGNIFIAIDESPMSVEIIIKDNGKGIPKNKLKKVFERFYKDENNINPQSIGIGLALTKAIVESHEGHIYVDSELGKWTSFHISFLKI